LFVLYFKHIGICGVASLLTSARFASFSRNNYEYTALNNPKSIPQWEAI